MSNQFFCTSEGTKLFKKKFKKFKNFYNINHQDLNLSSVGLGLYKGEVNEKSRFNYRKIIEEAIKSGFNVIDTARKYRNGFSEKDAGIVLNKIFSSKEINRGAIFVSSKVGLINFPKDQNKEIFLKENIIKKRGIKPNDLKRNIFCLSRKFINQEIDFSLRNLKLKTLDNYYLHNPEYLESKRNNFKSFYKIFETMEELVVSNKIKSYGISSWSGFRRFGQSNYYLDIKKILKIAKIVGGNNHNFKNIQIPLNIAMPFVLNSYFIGSKNLIEYFKEQKINIFTSATLYEGKLLEFFNLINLFQSSQIKIDTLNDFNFDKISFPDSEYSVAQLISTLNKIKENKESWNLKFDKKIFLYALNVVRSISPITSSLCGMDKLEFLRENKKITKMPRLTKKALKRFWTAYL